MQHLLTIARTTLFGDSPSALVGPLSGGLICLPKSIFLFMSFAPR